MMAGNSCELRTRLVGEYLRINRISPAERSKGQLLQTTVAVIRHRRFLEALANGIAQTFDNEIENHLVDAVNSLEDAHTYLSPREKRVLKDRLNELQAEAADTENLIRTATTESNRVKLQSVLADIRRRQDQVVQSLNASQKVAPPAPVEELEVSQLLEALADVVRGADPTRALEQITFGLQPLKIDVLTVHFGAGLLIPRQDGGFVRIRFNFPVENIRRVTADERDRAYVDLCLQNAWPAKAVAAGIPFVSMPRKEASVAQALSARFAPLLGSKAGSVLGGCQSPEVLAVLSNHFGLGTPQIRVSPALRDRILERYVQNSLVGANSWIEEPDHFPMTDLVRTLHERGEADAGGNHLRVSHWVKRGYLQQVADRYVAERCHCGSRDLAFIPTPEPEGLVCLSCREDRTGVVFPASWNMAVRDRAYWQAQGYDLEVPPIPGIPRPSLDFSAGVRV